ncbi:hypothetical protein [Maricaulis parjimensis]|uniref:hypothetical protein n=1 Tax=Maricaulis parjimensis TaxID=144023 RepID=UPI0019397B8B|nr:hypothetical protein [Maricaulis parjimensis]
MANLDENPYFKPDYAHVAARGLRVVQLQSINTAVIVRPTPVGQAFDAIGPYPLARVRAPVCVQGLRDELKDNGLVTLSWVQDPFEVLPPEAKGFDLKRAYKIHHVYDRERGDPVFPGIHQRNTKRALKLCSVREIDLQDHLEAWCGLYDNLIQRQSLTEAHAFDQAYFESLANIVGFRTLGAFVDETLVSAHIWSCAGDRAYSHLAASSATGYKAGAAYAVNAFALSHFAGYRFLNFGGVPDGGNAEGLEGFKKGFANTTREAFLCGAVGDRAEYDALNLVGASGKSRSSYFPAYRA